MHAACHRAGSQSLQQLHYALTDLALHTSYVPGPGTSVQTSHVFREVTANTTVIAPVEEDRRAPCICGKLYATEWEAPCMFPPTPPRLCSSRTKGAFCAYNKDVI